jgi:beta-aspartyl-peptidase (threonine type)
MQNLSIAIHGGAGPRVKGANSAERNAEYEAVLSHALNRGWQILQGGGSSTDAVEQAVMALEDSPLFNAGRGSVFTAKGTHELDASIMEGKTLDAGAVCSVSGIKNPVCLAKDVMQRSEHVFLAAQGALDFAKSQGYEFADQDYFSVPARYQQLLEAQKNPTQDEKSHGTVGAVACDADGNLAAATSTGGVVNKQYGRVGDSPMIGVGNYANNQTCAVSCTGTGEYFIRGVVAYDVACLIEHKGKSLEAAAHEVIHERLLRLKGDGGLIAVDTQGNIAMPFNTKRMFRASQSSGAPPVVLAS